MQKYEKNFAFSLILFFIHSFYTQSVASAESFDESLLLIPNAFNEARSQSNGVSHISCQLKIQFPAASLISDLNSHLEKLNWKISSQDVHNSDSKEKEWHIHTDTTVQPALNVRRWNGQWKNKNGDILTYTLRYLNPTDGEPDLSTLHVGARHFSRQATVSIQKEIDAQLQMCASDNDYPRRRPSSLVSAIECGNLSLVELLLELQANPNALDRYGNSALMIASKIGQKEIAQVLISYGADVNLKSQNGSTALFAAAENGHLDVVKFLLLNDADVNVETLGKTITEVAAEKGYAEIVNLLTKADTRN
ncbi:ankyrin repeat domain-containing protein [bacterium]|nr:ankyrin repeat domain-containing protein [bacterium]